MDVHFFDQLTESSCIITANQRLCRQIREAYDKHMSQSQTTFASLDVLPLSQWLKRTWIQTTPQETLLSAEQVFRLWQQLVENDESYQSWLMPMNTAKLAEQAFDYHILWQIPLTELQESLMPETELLARWIQKFEQHLEMNHWLAECQLPNQLQKSLPHLPKQHYLLVGFDELPPAIQQLCQALAMQSYENAHQLGQTQQLTFSNPEQELKAMATWAKQQYQRNPTAHIGCIVPNLAEDRDKVWRVFIETFSPEYLMPGQTSHHFRTHNLQFNLSAGVKFAEIPIIKTALLALQFSLQSEWSIEALHALISQPYCHRHAQDAMLASHTDYALRELGQPYCTIEDIGLVAHALAQYYSKSQLIHRTLQLTQRLHGEHSYDYWAQRICHKLQSFGWPGHRTLNSTETQALERFRQLLTCFISLSEIDTKTTWHQAVKTLKDLASQIVFQPRTDYTPIQVLGTLEAAGTKFDQIWLMGLTDDIWPPKPSPNPLLPFNLQQKYQLPHCNSERELAYCKNVLKRILQAAPNIIISHAKQNADQPLTASPLIPKNIDAAQLTINCSEDVALQIYQQKNLEYFSDESGPQIQPEEKIHGGSYLLQQQANCPFQAFAHLRLKSQSLATTSMGLNAAERGILLHHALEHFWTHTGNQKQLLSLSEKNLQLRISHSVETALQKNQQRLKHHLFSSIEKERLQQRLTTWLQIEKQRPNFIVTGFEQKITYTCQGITLNMTVDRIDQFNNNEQIIIDYKTGLSNVAGWFDERLTAPQLPVYSLAMGEQCKAISYAIVKSDKNAYSGISADSLDIKGITRINKSHYCDTEANWLSVRDDWQQKIERLCHEFQSGVATVAPANPTTCQYCDLQVLCRVHEYE